MLRSKKILLLVTLLLAGFLRLWSLDTVPPSLYWDEVSQGFNAYSILKTGKDEHQESFPLTRFQAFGDYKAPVYIYLDVPFIALFGQTELAVRLPSAIFGTLTVFLVFLLVQKLFYNYKQKESVALFAAFFLAISPGHIQMSRAAFEGNIATFFLVLAVLLFYWSLREKPWLLLVSSVSFVLSFYAFNAHRVFIPLLLLLLGIVYFRPIFKERLQAICAILLGVVLLTPFLFYIQTFESRLRFREVNIFSDIETVKTANMLQEQEGYSFFSKIIHNRRVLFAREYAINYFDFFNPSYLFFRGDINPRFSHQENGQLFLWMLPLLILGVYRLVTLRVKEGIVILGWFLLAPIAAATARETPHALRSITFIPMYEIIAAFGATVCYFFLKEQNKKLQIVSLMAVTGIISFSIINFLHNYFVHNPVLYSADWQYGYKQVIEKVEKIKGRYDKIYITNTYGRPSIYVAWYTKMNPGQYWKDINSTKDVYGFYNVYQLGKYYFVDRPPATDDAHVLYVVSPDQLPLGAKVIDTVQFLNGQDAFLIAEK